MFFFGRFPHKFNFSDDRILNKSYLYRRIAVICSANALFVSLMNSFLCFKCTMGFLCMHLSVDCMSVATCLITKLNYLFRWKYCEMKFDMDASARIQSIRIHVHGTAHPWFACANDSYPNTISGNKLAVELAHLRTVIMYEFVWYNRCVRWIKRDVKWDRQREPINTWRCR